MNGIATVDTRGAEYERIRATRVEVARLLTLGYRVKLTPWQQTMALLLAQRHMQSLPVADQTSFLEGAVERENPSLDWSVLDEPWARKAIEQAVGGVLSRWGYKLSATKEDMTQCAQILLAEKPKKYRDAVYPGVFLYRDLAKLVRFEHRDASLEELLEFEEGEEDEPHPVWMPSPYVAVERR